MRLLKISCAALLILGQEGCVASRGDGRLVAPTPEQTYANVAAILPLGTPKESAIAALEAKGWSCWGFADPEGVIRPHGATGVMKGPVLRCESRLGFGVYPLPKRYTARLLFQQDILAGIELDQGGARF